MNWIDTLKNGPSYFIAGDDKQFEGGRRWFKLFIFFFMGRINTRAGDGVADPVIISHMRERLTAIKGLLITNIDSPFPNVINKLVNSLEQWAL